MLQKTNRLKEREGDSRGYGPARAKSYDGFDRTFKWVIKRMTDESYTRKSKLCMLSDKHFLILQVRTVKRDLDYFSSVNSYLS